MGNFWKPKKIVYMNIFGFTLAFLSKIPPRLISANIERFSLTDRCYRCSKGDKNRKSTLVNNAHSPIFQLQQFDCELQPLKEVLVEYPITFPPTYPFEEDPLLPQNFMLTRCPAWCDRILMSPDAKNLINDNNFSSLHYNTIGNDVCMGDHKVNISMI